MLSEFCLWVSRSYLKLKLKRMGLDINYAKRVASAEFSEYYPL